MGEGGAGVGSTPRTGPWASNTQPVWDSAFPVDALLQQVVSSVYPVLWGSMALPKDEGLGEWTEAAGIPEPRFMRGSRQRAGPIGHIGMSAWLPAYL